MCVVVVVFGGGVGSLPTLLVVFLNLVFIFIPMKYIYVYVSDFDITFLVVCSRGS